MKIVLTSFRDAKNWNGTKCSIARWQPEWSNIPEFPVDIKPIYKGQVLHNKLPPAIYKVKYQGILKAQEEKLINFFSNIENDATIVLCCWCTLDRPGNTINGKLFCHRILVGHWIEEHFQYAIVIYTDGAEKSIWKKIKR